MVNSEISRNLGTPEGGPNIQWPRQQPLTGPADIRDWVIHGRYVGEGTWSNAKPLPFQLPDFFDGLCWTKAENVPTIWLEVPQGIFVGLNYGEFCGETFVFTDDHKPKEHLSLSNPIAYVLMGDRVVSVTGLAHLAIDEGYVAVYQHGEEQGWHIVDWHCLPSVPRTVSIREDRLRLSFRDGEVRTFEGFVLR
jgi:hypothetical protein